jgi:hypothetical protein
MPFKKANTEERASLTVRIVHLFWLAVSKRNKFCDGALLNEMTDCAFFIFLLDCFIVPFIRDFYGLTRVARFFSVQLTKTEKIYQMTTKCTNRT